MSIDSRDSTAVFGGYNNSTSALAATAADGAGHYAVVGTSGTSAYLAVYNSGDHSQVCQTTFVPVDPFDPLHIYDQGRAFGVAYGAGAVYVAGEAHDTTSTSDDFDGFGQGFNPATCAKVGSVVIEGGPDHDAFKGVAVGASGVILAGYIHLQGDDQFLAERWSADLSTNSYAFFYPITGTAGGNHTNAVATDALGNAWVFGFLHLTPAGTDQRLELHALDPAGAVVGGSVFFASDSGPSQYTSVRRGADGLLYSGGTIIDTTLVGGPGPFGIFQAGWNATLTANNCGVYFTGTIASSGMDVDGASPANLYGVLVLDPALAPPLPDSIIKIKGTDCSTVAGDASTFGSSDGVDTPGGVGFDTNTNTARVAAATTGMTYTPNTDGSILVPPQNGYLSEFGSFAP